MINKIGLMQGRLTEPYKEIIQSFPWDNWEQEILIARENRFKFIEWTIDDYNFFENPLISNPSFVMKLLTKNNVTVKTVTADFVMQKPLHHLKNNELENEIQKFILFLSKLKVIGIKYIIYPLVDNGSIKNKFEEIYFFDILENIFYELKKFNIKILFESDYTPKNLKKFISNLPDSQFGINYDTGNSASLGYEINEEFSCYSTRIKNIHIKDRKFKGTTVHLGEGDVDFKLLFRLVKNYHYNKLFILQSARKKKGDELQTLNQYRNFILNKMEI